MNVLVTGGAGYIGSHTVVEMIQAGLQPVILDNLSNSGSSVIDRIEAITGVRPPLVIGDVRDRALLDSLFIDGDFQAVIHFAGLKSVGESAIRPLDYYDNNVAGTVVLAQAMSAAGVRNLVFSSSATVYGDPDCVPIPEDAPLRATNPYGQSKLTCEQILRDVAKSEPSWSVTVLRYFNPVGAHDSGSIGEDPAGIPNNLVPFIAQVAIGRREHLNVFGADYPTPDGTGVRDYIHVVDLARGHLAALAFTGQNLGCATFNLGTGVGTSVLGMVAAFEQACGGTIPYCIVERRAGDVGECYADPRAAQHALGWTATRGIAEMAASTWNWQSRNPSGYR